MSLLDLPLELFEMIMEQTVDVLGIRATARARLVCKVFNQELQRFLYEHEAFSVSRPSPSSSLSQGDQNDTKFDLPIRMSPEMVVRLLKIKMKTFSAGPLSINISRVLEVIALETGRHKEGFRTPVTEALVDAAARHNGLWCVLEGLNPHMVGGRRTSKRSYQDALIAAIYMEDQGLVQSLLSRDVDETAYQGRHFGTTLQAVQHIDSEPIRRCLLEKNRGNAEPDLCFQQSLGKVLQDAAAGGYQLVVRLILEERGLGLRPEEYNQAITNAVGIGNADIVHLLLRHKWCRLPNPHYIRYREDNKHTRNNYLIPFWISVLGIAIRAKYEDVLRILLDSRFLGRSDIPINYILLQVWSNHLQRDDQVPVLQMDGVRLLLRLLPENLAPYASALGAASHDGNIAVIDTLLEHGADINGDAKVLTTPLLETAVTNPAPILRHLLGKGASVQRRSGGIMGWFMLPGMGIWSFWPCCSMQALTPNPFSAICLRT